MSIRALSLDIWGNLLHGNKNYTAPRLHLMFKLLGLPMTDLESARAAYRSTGKHFDRKSEETGIDYGMADRLAMLFELLGISMPRLDDETVNTLQYETGLLRLQDEYMPTLIESDLIETLGTYKSQGIKIGILSNTGIDNGMAMRPILAKLGILQLADAVVFSNEEGIAKPNPAIFAEMASRLGLAPGEIVHVGDNAFADGGAIAAGMQFAHFAPAGSNGPHITTMKQLDQYFSEQCMR